jgi:hypothetical protein
MSVYIDPKYEDHNYGILNFKISYKNLNIYELLKFLEGELE